MNVIISYDLECDGQTYTMEELGLEGNMEIPDDISDDDISDYISDKTGWCVLKWWKV